MTDATTGDKRVKARKPSKEKKPRTAAAPPTKARRRPMIIAAGVALAVVGGLGSWAYATSTGDTQTVLVTSTDVSRGEQISSGDLTTMEIAGGQQTSAYSAAQSTSAIGQVALVDLPAGSLVTRSNTGDVLIVDAGKSIVGVALTSAQMPSQPLAAGDSVRLVDTPVPQGDPPQQTPQTFTATVFAVRFDEKNARWIADLVVPKDKAADIAARAATGRVALILDSGE